MYSLKIFLLVIVFPKHIISDPLNEQKLGVFEILNGEKDWWQSCSLYQIYPRSFKDSDGDGIGDIKGITQNLRYLKTIGVTATWLSPIFKSPMVDFGYDISDFYGIQPEYGTMEDFEELIQEARRLDIKIILDFVPNHSSDECEWFKKSVQRDPQYEDYYVWHPGFIDPKNASNRLPPNNWVSVFRGSAWTWNAQRGEFYLHKYAVRQPDLNFRNPKVVQEMKNVLTYWFDRGADGFRIDAIPQLFEIEKDEHGNYADEPLSGWTDDPNDYGYTIHIYTRDLPETTDMIYQWRQVTDEWQQKNGGDTKILLAEAYSNIDVIMQYYGNSTHEGAHLPFNFNFINNLSGTSNANDIVREITTWMNKMPAGRTANWVLGNHDKPRAATRFGEDRIDLLNMLMMMMPGATVTYQGEEIGMTDVYISWEETVDPQACNTNPEVYLSYSRDPCRTPFQWDNSTSAGFSSNQKTWLPVSETYSEVNVKKESQLFKSHLNIYRAAKLLRNTRAFRDGELLTYAPKKDVLIVARIQIGEPLYVYISNIGHKLERVDSINSFPLQFQMMVVVSSTISPRRNGEFLNMKEIMLLPGEALILKSAGILIDICEIPLFAIVNKNCSIFV